MEFVRESIFRSIVRSFCNAFVAMIGVIIGLVILFTVLMSFGAQPYATSDTDIEMKFLPDAEGNSDLIPGNIPVILQISIDGVIGDGQITGDLIESYLRLSRKGLLKHDRVKGILLYINSPGGTVIDSDRIFAAVRTYKEKFQLPVYAFTTGYCASGGYMIACSADKIYATPIALVGSVGVRFGPMFNFWDFMQTHGITSLTLSEGKYKLKYPSFGPLPMKGDTSSSYADLIDIMKAMYDQFVTLVEDARKEKGLTRKNLIDDFGAQIFIAESAKQKGYVDVSDATYDKTLLDLVAAAQIQGAYQVVEFQQRRSAVQDLFVNQVDLWMKKAQESLLGIPAKGRWESEFLYYFSPKDRTL